MNKLLTFLARADVMDRPNKQELFEINNSQVWATVDRAQINSDMLREGYNEWADVTITAGAAQFASKPAVRQKIRRVLTNKWYFVQKLDSSDPVLWTLDLVDREPHDHP